MKLTILGSAAAEGIPALFCDCEVCRRARQRGGREVRRRTGYLWDDDILIDLGPDLFFAQISFELDYARLRHLLITHSHPDHFHPQSLRFRRVGFSVLPEACWLTVHCNAQVEEQFRQTCPGEPSEYFLNFERAVVGQEIELDSGRSAVPVAAAHDEREECLNYILKADQKTILIGNDTGWWEEATWELLAEHRFDVAIIDCTYGRRDDRRSHLGMPGLIAARDRLQKLGALNEDSLVIANHFTHNGQINHAELVEVLGPEGIEVGYDGMQIEM